MSNFKAQLDNLTGMAMAAITVYMDGKQVDYMPNYIVGETENADDIDILDEWPTFDTLDGDINSLICINTDDKGNIILEAILQMRREPAEFAEYRLDDLSAEALCSICDGLGLEAPEASTPSYIVLNNIVNAHANNDPHSMERYMQAAYEVVRGDPK